MKRVHFRWRNVVAIAVCLAATTAFAACEPADEPNPDAPAIAEFTFANQRGASAIDAQKRTVKATAECGTNIASLSPEFKLSPEGTTAKVNGNLQTSGKTAHNFADAVVYTLTTPNGESAEWTVTVTLPDDCPQVKKYITYNQPVKAYFIEYNGGAIDANKGKSDRGNPIAEACENKKYSSIHWGLLLGDNECWVIEAIAADGTMMYGTYKSGQWLTDNESANPDDSNAVDWRTEDYKSCEYPLGQFAAWVSAHIGYKQNFLKFSDLWGEVAKYPTVYALPNNTEVTELYKKSEDVCQIMCDVYQDTDGEGHRYTFWVVPETGFTLKFEKTRISDNAVINSYEVTKWVVGTPEWNELHLHLRNGDTLTNLHQ